MNPTKWLSSHYSVIFLWKIKLALAWKKKANDFFNTIMCACVCICITLKYKRKNFEFKSNKKQL